MAYTHLDRAVKRVRRGKNPATPRLARRAVFALGKRGRQAEAKWHRRVAWYADQSIQRLQSARADIIAGRYLPRLLSTVLSPRHHRKPHAKQFVARMAGTVAASTGSVAGGYATGSVWGLLAGIGVGFALGATGIRRATNRRLPRDARLVQAVDEFLLEGGFWCHGRGDTWVNASKNGEYSVESTGKRFVSEVKASNRQRVEELLALLRKVRKAHYDAMLGAEARLAEKNPEVPDGT